MKGTLSYNPKHIEFMMKDSETEEVTLYFKSGTQFPMGKISDEEYENIVRNINLASQVHVIMNDDHISQGTDCVMKRIPMKRKGGQIRKREGMALNVQA